MSYPPEPNPNEPYIFQRQVIRKNNYLLHLVLFLITFVTTMIAGAQWASKDFTEISNWHYGFTYSVLILTFLSFHEFGHYIAARIHKVDATLPFYIPNPIPYVNFGTFGAVIRTRTPILTRKALFDIGVAGPISGFIACSAMLIYGLITLPPQSYIYTIHPDYLSLKAGTLHITDYYFGDTIFYSLMAKLFANPHGWLPPMNEIYHYPFLCVGWFGLFVTSLNMLPLGQLDGGHVTYSMFGRWQAIIARIFWWFIIIVGMGFVLSILYDQLQVDYPNKMYIFVQNIFLPILNWMKINIPWYFNGWGGWLFWALMTRLVIRLKHPPIADPEPLDSKRMLIGWLAIIILIVSFAYNGIYVID